MFLRNARCNDTEHTVVQNSIWGYLIRVSAFYGQHQVQTFTKYSEQPNNCTSHFQR